MSDTNERFREIIQNYVNQMKKLLAKNGDKHISVPTMYGGATISEEIELAEKKIASLTEIVPNES